MNQICEYLWCLPSSKSGYYSIANSFTKIPKAKTQFNILGSLTKLKSKFSSILLPPILYHTCTTPIRVSTFRVNQHQLVAEFNIVHYCSCMIKNKTITKCLILTICMLFFNLKLIFIFRTICNKYRVFQIMNKPIFRCLKFEIGTELEIYIGN